MLVPSIVDMSRPTTLYAAGLGLIMLVSLVVTNVPALAFSAYFELPFRREACAALFLLGVLMGAVAIMRHLARVKQPWKIPQSQISLPYAAFFGATLLGVLIAR